jgi:hypothetical protein
MSFRILCVFVTVSLLPSFSDWHAILCCLAAGFFLLQFVVRCAQPLEVSLISYYVLRIVVSN